MNETTRRKPWSTRHPLAVTVVLLTALAALIGAAWLTARGYAGITPPF